MKSLKDIQKMVRQFNIKPRSEMRSNVLDKALNIQRSRKQQNSSDTYRWRIIMKSRTAKLAAAIIVIVIAGMSFFGRFTTPAWAIDQTIEALRNIRGIYLSGVARYPGEPECSFEIWARPHSTDASISGDFRLVEGEHHISIAIEKQNLTFVYTQEPGRDAVYITEGLNRSCNPFLTSDLFEQLKKMARNWKEEYGTDPETGRECVFVTFEGPPVNTARYWEFEFDVETKFPVRGGVWRDESREGQPHFDYRNIIYDPEMPEDLFDFDIPEGTQVIDCRKVRKIINADPDCGTAVDNLTVDQACVKVVKEYWQAVIEEDRAKIEKIRPLAVGSGWEQAAAAYEKNKPESLVNISGMNHLNDPGTFAEVTCIIKTNEGKTAESVLNVEVRQTTRGKIGVVAGVKGSELSIMN